VCGRININLSDLISQYTGRYNVGICNKVKVL